MAGTRDAILDALEDLTADELKKFKMKLLSVTLREGYRRIPRGTLLPMDAVDLTDKLVSSYLGPYATELTTHVLSEMGMQDTAARLQAKAARAGSGAAPAEFRAPPPQMVASPALHFVDRHRKDLIQRVTDVNGVLDVLHGNVLSEEQYEAVRAEATNQDKMRRLFSFAPAWNLTCKELLFQALKDTQPFLVSDLEKS
ncbi:PREDICTED: apoptosis-associated speck-like protein containing a CARD isoform X1 [Miniopterus natalensis]|uniref:apoptosis-associated speck-like protein containing a CARD isoform X1 n=1 Tax=Miniopterus natalensis TaxID=291302 RepID=UPI0007A6DEFA|nr:PREDICTED: apoptosis-associated speck-like protein containing a CARD isoform X1 [Miniopterus natalensis]